MTEPSAAPSNTHNANTRSTSLALLSEDDDEPPSRSPHHWSSEVKPPLSESSQLPMHSVVQDGISASANPSSNEKDPKGLKTVTASEALHRPSPGRQNTKPIRGGNFAARLHTLFAPKQLSGPRPTYKQSALATLKYTPLNICLLFIPVSWALHFTHQSPTLIFVFSSLGIIPLAALLGLGTEQIALRTSQSVGGLLNATLGNIVELIIAGIALGKCELEVVQSSLLGGLLSNLLLVLGMAFLVGGFRFHQQEFQPMVAQLNSSLMIVCVISLIVPVAFHEYVEERLPPGTEIPILLQLSRGSAIILILIYIGYLFFQFYSHNHLFLDTCQTSSSSSSRRSSLARVSTDTLPIPSVASSESEEHVKLNTPFAILILVATTALAYVTAESLVDSLEGLVAAHPNISKEWITLIVIPIISNAAEHTTAVVVARKGKFDLAMSVAVGSCIQIALFVIPLLVIIGWGMGKPLTLLFDPLETLVLFFSVLIVKFSIEDGKSHWLSGVVLIAVYTLIALCFWNFPETHRVIQGQALYCPTS